MKQMKKTDTPETPFKLQDLINESLTAFRNDPKFKKVSLHLIDDLVSPLSIMGNREHLKEVLGLLLSNGVELVRASKVIISLRQLLKTENEVLLEFTVEDDGLKKQTDFIDHRYSYKRSLASVRSLIKEFGGKAEISSFEGIGTTIKFLAKFYWVSEEEEVATTTKYHRLSGKKILVVEDNEINQKIIAHLLRKEKILVNVANDGKQAIELFEKAKYDLILLDLQMPFMDGFQTANYIRKKLLSTVPIVAMTASAFANEQTRCFEVGINQYLSKPFTPDDLFKRLRYFLLKEHVVSTPKASIETVTKNLFSLQSLKQTNEEEQILEILEMFIEDTPYLLDQIKKDVDRQDAESFFKNTAKFKGSLGSLQMQSMMKVVNQLELFIRTDDMAHVPSTINELYRSHESIVPLIQAEVKKLKSKSKAI
jgi:CheY-like chemotaxis protein